jgi:uncharacterized Zn finger protein
MSGINSFGRTLRAYRLGYAPSEKHGAFIRLEMVDDASVNVTLIPLNHRVPDGRRKKLHVVWWESSESKQILDLIPALKNVRRVKKVISFDIDIDTGERITE